jgi:hypothetical protein
MDRIALAVTALLACLLPIGFYCLILAAINRRARPLVVSGFWDTVGLLFAVSGFFLVTMPMLLSEFAARSLLDDMDHPLALWVQHWIVELGYYLILLCGSAVVLILRGRKTQIYNVDVEQFPKALETALAGIGLAARHEQKRLVVTASPSADTAFTQQPATMTLDRRHAELRVETFAAMRHVTLHWTRCTPETREQIEAELEKNLESAAPLENPAAGWFLNISGMIFGALIMAVLTFVIIVFFLARR